MKKTLALVVSTLVLSLASVASAQTYTYDFTGTSSGGQYPYPANFIDGSTLTISDGAITGYDFTGQGYGNFGTPSTTTVVSSVVTSYGANGWAGELDLGYQYIDIEVTGDSFASQALGASITGTWTAVPDGASTFALLGMALAGLAAGRPLLRRLA